VFTGPLIEHAGAVPVAFLRGATSLAKWAVTSQPEPLTELFKWGHVSQTVRSLNFSVLKCL
jgi:hypothetical protein